MKQKLNRICLAAGLMSLSTLTFANAPDVTQVVTDLGALVAPIGLVGAARMGVNVAIRGWKIVGRMV